MEATEKKVQLDLFRSILDRESMGVCVFLPVGRTDFLHVYVNPAYQALKPYRPMLGRLYSEVWPELAQKAIPYLFRILDSGVAWSEVRQPFDVERDMGSDQGQRYFTREISRVAVGDEYFLVATAFDVTSEVESMTERRRTERALNHELEITTMLLSAADELTGTMDMDRALDSLMDVIAATTGRKRMIVSLYDPQTEEMIVTATSGDTGVTPGTRMRIDHMPPGIRLSLESKEIRVIDYETDEMPDDARRQAEAMDIRLLLSAPLVINDEVIGHLGLDEPGVHLRFTSHEMELVGGIAAQAAVAIQNARLFEDQRRSTEYAEALNRINQAVHSTLSVDEIIRRAAVEVTQVLGFDGAAVHIRKDGRWRFEFSYGLPDELRQITLTDEQAPLSMSVLRDGRPVALRDAMTDARANRQLMSRFNIRALVGLPLMARGEAIGVFFTGSRTQEATVGDRAVDFLGKVTSVLALAMENARLYEAEHDIAETLQQALLAVPDRVPGIELAHAYRSASETARVGGDFYDVFEIEHRLVGVLIGDVAGKGLEAAVLTSLLKNTVRAHATTLGAMPASVLELTNKVVYKDTLPESFATVFFGVLDLESGSLVYCNAGHTTAAVIRSGGRSVRLPSISTVIGAFLEARFEQAEIVLGDGDTLFTYTDGLTEAREGGRLFGEERLFDILSGQAGVEPAQLVGAVMESVGAFAPSGLSDDLAVLAVRLEDRERLSRSTRPGPATGQQTSIHSTDMRGL